MEEKIDMLNEMVVENHDFLLKIESMLTTLSKS